MRGAESRSLTLVPLQPEWFTLTDSTKPQSFKTVPVCTLFPQVDLYSRLWSELEVLRRQSRTMESTLEFRLCLDELNSTDVDMSDVALLRAHSVLRVQSKVNNLDAKPTSRAELPTLRLGTALKTLSGAAQL